MSRETQLLRAQLLIEAAELLDESAKSERKELISEVDQKKLDIGKDFFSGKLEKDKAEKIYKDFKKDAEKLKKSISKMSAETESEADAASLKALLSKEGVVSMLAAAALGLVGGFGFIKLLNWNTETIGKLIIKLSSSFSIGFALGMGENLISALLVRWYFGKPTEVDDEGNQYYNFNKSLVIKKLTELEKKVEKCYNKYYKD